jgi:hypothetical protein
LRRGIHTNKHFQHAWNRDGEKSFVFEILEEVDQEYLIEKEVYYVDLYDTRNPEKGYNLLFPDRRKGGFHHTEETKKKIAETSRGRIFPPKSPELRYQIGTRCRDKTYEELYGAEKAQQMKERCRERGLSHAEERRQWLQGKTYEEIYGIEVARQMKEKQIKYRTGRSQSDQKKEKCRLAKLKEANPMYKEIPKDVRKEVVRQYLENKSRNQISKNISLTPHIIKKILLEASCL